MAENCPIKCPLYQSCKPHFRMVSAMTEAAMAVESPYDTSPENVISPTAPALTGVVLQNDHNASLYEDTAAAEVAFINAQEGCTGSKMTFIGKLIYGMKILGATSGSVPSQEDLDMIRTSTEARYQKCPSRKAHSAYRLVKRLKLLAYV